MQLRLTNNEYSDDRIITVASNIIEVAENWLKITLFYIFTVKNTLEQ